MERKQTNLARKLVLALLAALMCVTIVLGVTLERHGETMQTDAPITAEAADTVATAEDLAALGYKMAPYMLEYTQAPNSSTTIFFISFNGQLIPCQVGTYKYTNILQKGNQEYFFFIPKTLPSIQVCTVEKDGKTNPSWSLCSLTSAWDRQMSIFLLQLGTDLKKDSDGRIFFDYKDALSSVTKRFYLGANGYTDNVNQATSVTQEVDTGLAASILVNTLDPFSTEYDGTEQMHPVYEYWKPKETALSKQVIIVSGGTGQKAGKYSLFLVVNKGYKLLDGSTDGPKYLSWEITKADPSNGAVQDVKVKQKQETAASALLTDDGSAKSVLKSGGDGGTFTVTVPETGKDIVSVKEDTNGKTNLSDIKLVGGNKKGSTTVTIKYSGGTNLNDKTWQVAVENSLSAEIYTEIDGARTTYETLSDAINAAKGNGGTIYVNGELTVDASERFEIMDTLTLKSEGEGKFIVEGAGPLFSVNDKATFTLENLTVEGATSATTFAHVEKGGTLVMKETNVSGFNNSAVTVNEGILHLQSGSFFNNSATWEGGAIYAEGGSIQIDGTQFYGNTANGNGGAIYIHSCVAEFLSGSMTFNKGKSGGAVYVDEYASFRMMGGSIKQNKAEVGGGIYIESGSKMTISDASVSQNSASVKGGGIFLAQKGVLRIKRNVQIIDNKGALTDMGTISDNLFLSGEMCVILDGDISGSRIGIRAEFQDDSFAICDLGQYIELPTAYLIPDNASHQITSRDGLLMLCVA